MAKKSVRVWNGPTGHQQRCCQRCEKRGELAALKKRGFTLAPRVNGGSRVVHDFCDTCDEYRAGEADGRASRQTYDWDYGLE